MQQAGKGVKEDRNYQKNGKTYRSLENASSVHEIGEKSVTKLMKFIKKFQDVDKNHPKVGKIKKSRKCS